MRTVLYIIVSMLLLAGLGCNTNGPVAPSGNNPTIPPTGNNPGGQSNPLTAYIELSHTLGHAPMAVNMKAVVSGGIAPFMYKWDTNGDGFFEHGGVGIYEIGINYSSAGLYEITLEVVDNGGQSFQAKAIVDVQKSSPVAVPNPVPTIGYAPFMTSLRCADSYDPDGTSELDKGIVLYEWDFESDGVWDYESTSSSPVAHTYSQGTWNATLRVTDRDGLKGVASVQIVAL